MKPNNAHRAKVLGVTGGIGSGKSTVANILEGCGALVLDCDEISAQLTREPQVLHELVSVFGSSILGEDGQLARKRLAQIVFQDATQLSLLNKVMHSRVGMVVKERLAQYQGEMPVVIDCPIPVEDGFLDVCEEVWVVLTNRPSRLTRIVERDGMNEEEALVRINAQMSQEEYLKVADTVIENNEELSVLKKVVFREWERFKKGTNN